MLCRGKEESNTGNYTKGNVITEETGMLDETLKKRRYWWVWEIENVKCKKEGKGGIRRGRQEWWLKCWLWSQMMIFFLCSSYGQMRKRKKGSKDQEKQRERERRMRAQPGNSLWKKKHIYIIHKYNIKVKAEGSSLPAAPVLPQAALWAAPTLSKDWINQWNFTRVVSLASEPVSIPESNLWWLTLPALGFDFHLWFGLYCYRIFHFSFEGEDFFFFLHDSMTDMHFLFLSFSFMTQFISSDQNLQLSLVDSASFFFLFFMYLITWNCVMSLLELSRSNFLIIHTHTFFSLNKSTLLAFDFLLQQMYRC